MTYIGKYLIVRELGRGGMGVVFAARDPSLDRVVAIKLLNEHGEPERFLREAQVAAKVIHPNCVPIFDIGEHQGNPFIVMELVAGVSASEFLEKQGSLRWKTATRIVAAACRGLSAIHEAGIVHRDVKPANLLISKSGAVKVADFGLARVVGKHVPSLTGDQVVGTPHYMSPEQCWSEPVDPRSDIYSLGGTYFVLLTSQPPYHADHPLKIMFAHCNDPVPDPRSILPSVPESCAKVVLKAMAKAPADRYQSAREMLKALELILTSDTTDDSSSLDEDTPSPPAGLQTTKADVPAKAAHDWQHVAPGLRGQPTPAVLDEKTPRVEVDPEQIAQKQPEPPKQPEQAEKPPQEGSERRLTRRGLLVSVPLVLAATGVAGYFAFRKHEDAHTGDPQQGDSPKDNQPKDNQPKAGGKTDPVAKSPVRVPIRPVGAAVGDMNGIAVTDDGRWLAVALNDREKKVTGVKLFDRTLGDVDAVSWLWGTEPCEAVAFSPDGKWLAVATGQTGKVRVWSMENKQKVDIPQSGGGLADVLEFVSCVAFSPDNKLLAASIIKSFEPFVGFVRVWDVDKWTHLRDLKTFGHRPIRRIAFAPDGKILVAALQATREELQPLITAWDAPSGEHMKTRIKLTQATRGPCLAFARKEPLLAYSWLEGVELAQPRSFEPGTRFPTKDEPGGLALSHDGNLVAFSIRSTIHVLDTETGLGHTLEGQDEVINAIAFTADGKTLISGNTEGAVHEWVIPPPEPPS
jgi:serine/threonine protein kinase/WD40 repeat protein